MSNWNGKAIKIPRIEVPNCNRDDINQAGVYFLFCKNDDGKESVYIGEAENVKERLVNHIRDHQIDKEKYYWTTAVIFIGRDLNKALIRYLENRFVKIARECNRDDVLTKNTYKNTVMKESQIAVMEEFIDNVKILLNALGYKVLEPYVAVNSPGSNVDDSLLYIDKGSAKGTGKVTAEGFVLFKGSVINERLSLKSVGASTVKLREKYISEKKVENLKTVEDILFTSSSAAADFLLGYSVSGPATWKTREGKMLKEIDAD